MPYTYMIDLAKIVEKHGIQAVLNTLTIIADAQDDKYQAANLTKQAEEWAQIRAALEVVPPHNVGYRR